VRRLLGYIVKLPDGTRSPRTPKPVPVIGDAVDAWIGAPDGSCVCPVFATRKPKPAPPPPGGTFLDALLDKPKPASAEGAAEWRYGVLRKTWGGNEFSDIHYGDDTCATCHTGTREEATERLRKSGLTKKEASIVRILPDGAHEAACEAARREGAEAALRHAVGCLYDMIQATKEAAEGQAK